LPDYLDGTKFSVDQVRFISLIVDEPTANGVLEPDGSSSRPTPTTHRPDRTGDCSTLSDTRSVVTYGVVSAEDERGSAAAAPRGAMTPPVGAGKTRLLGRKRRPELRERRSLLSGCRSFWLWRLRGPSIRFILNGQRYELVREDVEQRLTDVASDVIRKHAVRVNGIWFLVIQAFEVATGIHRSEFTSNTARRHLAALGYEVAGEVEPRAGLPTARAAFTPAGAPSGDVEAPAEPSEEWHTEANVQASPVAALAAGGWRILSVANTATKARGIDVIAFRDAQMFGVEVEGFPSRRYADPARASEAKRTSPSTQAGHWYAQAVLAAMRLRGKEPTWRSVIALPNLARDRDLHTETAASLAAAQIEIWWVDQDGLVHWS
jgi:hypothetical protein